jgi:tRNA nucleotidyltransferase (CCA-adding enzyme)
MPGVRTDDLLERLAALPGGRRLLSLAREHPDIALVGGAVRDLLLDRRPRELDVSVAAGAAEVAGALAASSPDGEPIVHERFGTASLGWIDIAERRAESYPAPGALPEVRPGTIEEDLARRDFTVNALAVPLGGEQRGELLTVEHALEDLRAGSLRVLHERSFLDDPTRLLRLARYKARLGFEIEPRTLELARAALAAGALQTVSGGRVASELWLFTEESDVDGFIALGELGVLAALGLPARFDAEMYARALDLLPEDGTRGTLAMAVLFHPPTDDGGATRVEAGALMDDFQFLAPTRGRVLASAFGVDAVSAQIEPDTRPSQLRALLGGLPVEGIAIVGAFAGRRSHGAGQAVSRWLSELRHVRLEIDGADLLVAGLEQGPEIGRRLERTLEMKLDGELAEGREAEMSAALEDLA